MHPLALVFIIAIGTLIFVLPRQLVFVPFVLAVCYMTLGQEVVVGGLNFTIVRIVVLLGWIRLIVRGEIRALELNSIDKAFIWWVIVSCIAHTLLWQTSGALIYRLGRAYNAAGVYFLFRMVIQDIDGIEKLIKISAIIILPLSMLMILEMVSGRNMFSIFGAVAQESWQRDGSIRAQGPFMYAGLAGTFGAIVMPFYLALWFDRKERFKAVIGCVAATVITLTSHSSGPLMAYVAGIIGLMVWRYRARMRPIRYAILFSLISLHLVMKAPVWYLISKAGKLTGGTAWHRSYLIDMAIKHFDEWWLVGTQNTYAWMPYHLPSKSGEWAASSDITNQFILEGVEGGLFSMLLFILIVVLCFRQIGISLRLGEDSPFSSRIILWSLGSSLFANVVAMLSCSYFDQIIVIFWLILAMTSTPMVQGQLKTANALIGRKDLCLDTTSVK